MGSALMGSLQISGFLFDRGTFWVFLSTYFNLTSKKKQRKLILTDWGKGIRPVTFGKFDYSRLTEIPQKYLYQKENLKFAVTPSVLTPVSQHTQKGSNFPGNPL